MRYGSVCSGIEAASVAWEPLGWRPSFFSEIEPFPRAVLAHWWPGVPCHGDFTTIREGEYDPIDVIVGGTPCQSFSVAGLRGGMADDRGNLALQFLALAGRLRPRWVVWENVPGVLSSNEGRDFGSFVGGLGELGYGWAYRTLDAQFFGLAQRRKRVFVVGYLGDWRRAAAVLFERASLRGDPPPRREAGQRAPTIPSRSTAGGGLGTDFDLDGGLDQAAACDVADTLTVGANQPTGFVGDCVAEPLARSVRARANASHREDSDTYIPVISPALKSRDYKGPSSDGDGDGAPLIAFNLTPSNSNKDFNAREAQYAQAITGNGNRVSARGGDQIAHSLRAEGFDASEDGTGRGTPLVAAAYRTSGNCGAWDTGDRTDALTTSTDPNSHIIAFSSKDHGTDAENDLSPTLRAGGHNASHANAGVPPAIAFALRGREGGAMPEVHDQVSALRSASGGSTRDFIAYSRETNNGVSHGTTPETRPDQTLRELRDAVGEEAFSKWGLGIHAAFWAQEVLRSEVHGAGFREPTKDGDVLGGDPRPRAKNRSQGVLFALWRFGCSGRPSRRWRSPKQLAGELVSYLSELPCQRAPQARLMLSLWRAAEGLGPLRQALSETEAAWRSAQGDYETAPDVRGLRGSSPQSGPLRAPLHESQTGEGAGLLRSEVGVSAVRRLTPRLRECARLQGFPDAHLSDVRIKGKPPADGPMYKALGNSFAVPVVRWIGERIQMVDALPIPPCAPNDPIG